MSVLDVRTGIMIEPERDSMLTDFSLALIKDFYLRHDETPQEGFARAAKAWSGGKDDLAQRLYDAVSKGWFMFASPVLSNAPLPMEKVKGLPISCFLNFVDDSIDGLNAHTVETRWLAVLGGGVGGHWSNVRAVSNKSPGPIPFMHTMDSDMEAYKQGTVRRGSYAAYLDVSHPDIVEFLSLRIPTGDESRKCLGTGFHHGVNITDAFMDAVKHNKNWELIDPNDKSVRDVIKARDLWQQILETRYRTGEPYLCFIDTANRALPQALKDKGLRINGSNLCVAPETQVLTDRGYFPIADIAGETVKVWNGIEWSETTIVKTGENQKLIKVELSDGSTLEVTPYHKFYVQNNYHGEVVEVRAGELKLGDKLAKWQMPIIEFGPEFENAYANGFFSADGTVGATKDTIWLYGDKRELASYLELPGVAYRENDGSDMRDGLHYKRGQLKPKFTVPINANLTSKLNWLAGYLDGDGTVARNGSNQSIQFASVERKFLEDIRLMLGTMGVQLKIAKARDAGAYMMPDGNGGMKAFECREIWRGLITSNDVQTLLELGFSPNRLELVYDEPQRDARRFVTVAGISDEGRFDDTYCFNEPKRHMGIFNGILTGNCSEIFLPTAPGRTAVCCLSSLNAERFDEWKDTSLVADLIEMLDNVLDHFIEHATPSLSAAVNSARRERSLGLGLMGFHSYLQSKSVPFESEDARAINRWMFSIIEHDAIKSSERLAIERGEPADLIGTGRRNAHVMAIAPNANSSILMGTSPSVELWKANAFKQQTRAGTFFVKNEYLAKTLDAYGMNTDEVWKDIMLSKGSVQHLDFLSPREKAVFKTAIEVDQHWVVCHAADRQRFIDQGQSINLFFPPRADRAYLNSVHLLAYSEGLKSLYYLRTEAKNRAENTGVKIERNALKDSPSSSKEDEGCVACEG